jgi:hypothetical protein
MFRKMIVAVAILAAAFFTVNALGGTPVTTAQQENLNATKRAITDSGGINVAIAAYKIVNASAAAAWVHFYDLPCASVTQGTTVPTWVEVLATNSQTFTSFPVPITTTAELCVTSVTAYKGLTGSANGVGMQIFIQ